MLKWSAQNSEIQSILENNRVDARIRSSLKALLNSTYSEQRYQRREALLDSANESLARKIIKSAIEDSKLDARLMGLTRLPRLLHEFMFKNHAQLTAIDLSQNFIPLDHIATLNEAEFAGKLILEPQSQLEQDISPSSNTYMPSGGPESQGTPDVAITHIPEGIDPIRHQMKRKPNQNTCALQ